MGYYHDAEKNELQFELLIYTRLCGIVPVSLTMFLITLAPGFKRSPFRPASQAVGFGNMVITGALLICQSWLTGKPGTAALITWSFAAMYASNVHFLARFWVMICLTILYACAMYFYNPFKSDPLLCDSPIKYVGTRMQYILFSTLC